MVNMNLEIKEDNKNGRHGCMFRLPQARLVIVNYQYLINCLKNVSMRSKIIFLFVITQTDKYINNIIYLTKILKVYWKTN